MSPLAREMLNQLLADYTNWAAHHPLAANTRRTYRTQIAQYCDYLTTLPLLYGDPLHDPHARDYAVRDYKVSLQTVEQRKPASINLALAAIDHFYRFLGHPRPNVCRETIPQHAPRSLAPDEQKRLLRVVHQQGRIRDQALVSLLLYTGLRVSECAALNLTDVPRSARKGIVVIRSGKRDAYREIPLNTQVRRALDAWEPVRQDALRSPDEPALFLNRMGHRLSARSIATIVHTLGQSLELDISVHTLRHSWVTNLVRQGTDLVLVAALAGHRRLETTRRYSHPSAQDCCDAVERLQISY